MKALLMLAIVAGVAYGGYYYYGANAGIIDDPTYAEARLDYDYGAGSLNFVFIAQTHNEMECREEARAMWEAVLASDGDDEVELERMECKKELKGQYAGIFDNEPLRVTYVAFEPKKRHERPGRLVLWGASHAQAKMFCEFIKKSARGEYAGTISCIDP